MKAYLNKLIREKSGFLETLYSSNLGKMFCDIEKEPPPQAKGKMAQWNSLCRKARIEFELMWKHKHEK
jgi:hypothetical protein